MRFIEESYGRELYGELKKVFSDAVPEATVALEGAGVHWNCTVKHGDRQCTIHCFDVKGPEYLTSFNHQKETSAMGRTASKADTMAAARIWIEGGELTELHRQFQFVDKQKRSLSSIEATALSICPELGVTTRELKHQICDLYELWFRETCRSCRISYYGKNLNPDAVFHWDGCQLFTVQTGDSNHLAQLLKRWLCDHVKPSVLQREFPEIEMAKAASYYEEGRGVEGEFVESWDRIEKFYAEMNFPPAEEIRSLVKAMRAKGYDHKLRAGQSLYTLMLSRSRRHGLRQGQPHIAFQFRQGGMDVITGNFEGKSIEASQLRLTNHVAALLEQMARVAID
jgi:hypothetical protein